ncbi:hypothetical protein SLS58_002164 [Diplodia intermedia]|uniref:Uncharacterized protein n=1 Tax=Diplodia intermedia TaxID=856260 RepID=A0ABR3TZS9_9PEZI
MIFASQSKAMDFTLHSNKDITRSDVRVSDALIMKIVNGACKAAKERLDLLSFLIARIAEEGEKFEKIAFCHRMHQDADLLDEIILSPEVRHRIFSPRNPFPCEDVKTEFAKDSINPSTYEDAG